MTQGRKKEAIESNARQNSSLKKPQRLNLGCRQQNHPNGRGLGVRETLIRTYWMS